MDNIMVQHFSPDPSIATHETFVVDTTVILIIYRKVVRDYGLWNQLHVDKGREWYLMLFVQEKLSQYRNDLSKPAFLQTASKQVKLLIVQGHAL